MLAFLVSSSRPLKSYYGPREQLRWGFASRSRSQGAILTRWPCNSDSSASTLALGLGVCVWKCQFLTCATRADNDVSVEVNATPVAGTGSYIENGDGLGGAGGSGGDGLGGAGGEGLGGSGAHRWVGRSAPHHKKRPVAGCDPGVRWIPIKATASAHDRRWWRWEMNPGPSSPVL